MTSLAVFTFHSDFLSAAETLAEQLALPFRQEADYLLLLTPHYLCVQKTSEKSLPLYVDFASKRMNYRRNQSHMRHEALIRAMGLKKNTHPRIVDATAGLARESFLLASHGFNVQLIERSPIIHALVTDGMQRGLQDKTLAPIIQRMELIQSNALEWLKKTVEKPHIIYLDPMFPERKKSALSKLDMRIFHDLVGEDLDADQLLETALTCALKRVVVKRPRLAEELSGKKPTYSLSGNSNRFDIYIV